MGPVGDFLEYYKALISWGEVHLGGEFVGCPRPPKLTKDCPGQVWKMNLLIFKHCINSTSMILGGNTSEQTG